MTPELWLLRRLSGFAVSSKVFSIGAPRIYQSRGGVWCATVDVQRDRGGSVQPFSAESRVDGWDAAHGLIAALERFRS